MPILNSRPGGGRRALMALLVAAFWLWPQANALAHHVLGRPAYGLNEDSNTPPDMQMEIQVGEYSLTYMIYPAFPQPEKQGRINLYVTRLDNGSPFQGKVAFRARADSPLSWLGVGGEDMPLGVQQPDDNVFRQGFLFHEAGDVIITSEFTAGGEPYVIDFPMRIGAPPPVGPLGLAAGLLAAVIVIVSVLQRRRSMTGKVRRAHEGRARG